MERGQSTIEVAIVFPVLAAMLWWAISPPLVSIRALAARAAALAGARQVVVEERADAPRLVRTVEESWRRLGGTGSGQKVLASLSSRSVALMTRETGSGRGRTSDFRLQVARETD
jgi:membrane protein implicated in regulation of membrane protease activity